jgi:hypothetical protein
MKTKGVIHFFDESATMVVALFLYRIKTGHYGVNT